MTSTTAHHPGELAYLDSSFSGLVPCKVLGWVKEDPFFGQRDQLQVRLTASRGAYHKGEIISINPAHVVPREHVRGGRYIVHNAYSWE